MVVVASRRGRGGQALVDLMVVWGSDREIDGCGGSRGVVMEGVVCVGVDKR